MVVVVKVLLFARARELAGTKEIEGFELPAEPCSVASFLEAMVARFPPLSAGVDSCSVAVNQEYVGREHVLAAGDEVALLPPISGG